MRRALFCAVPLIALFATGARAQDHQGHNMTGHSMPAAERTPASADPAMPSTAAPQSPGDHAADAYYDPARMAKARDMLRYESGGMPNSKWMLDRLEWRPGRGRDGYVWEFEGWTGGDIDRLAVKSKGEGGLGGKAEHVEVQAGWFHALDPWFNLRAGVRQDIEPRPRRTHAVLAVEGLAPYWFELEGELFLSQKGELTARTEASYDQRITQSLILQPRAEVNLSAQKARDIDLGSGISSVEAGIRLRYEIVREFAPYVGVNWERKIGQTARYARLRGEPAGSSRIVVGVRFWL